MGAACLVVAGMVHILLQRNAHQLPADIGHLWLVAPWAGVGQFRVNASNTHTPCCSKLLPKAVCTVRPARLIIVVVRKRSTRFLPVSTDGLGSGRGAASNSIALGFRVLPYWFSS